MGGEERTHAATPRKRGELRKKGQVAKSVDLSSMLVLTALILGLHSFGGAAISVLQEYFTQALGTVHLQTADLPGLFTAFTAAGLLLLKVTGPTLALAATVGVGSNLAQTGLLVSSTPLKPDFNRMNPLNGVKRYMSTRGLFETAKSILKLVLISYIAYSTLKSRYPELVGTIHMDVVSACGVVGDVLYRMTIRIVSFLLVLSAADYGYQRYAFEKSIRMTAEEVKQEHKQSEGDPRVKSQIRRKQREFATKRMMKDVPTADVIVTNPTHFAVALKYDSNMRAPKVVAKGADLVAKRIRELGAEHKVPVIENPPLARTLYRRVEIGGEVPGDLYTAVAEVLAYVYSLNRKAVL